MSAAAGGPPDSRLGSRASLLVFSDDWGRHPSSCQHLVGRLLPDYDVLWVNTIGTRAPRLDLATVRRAAGKAREWAGQSATPAAASVEPRPHVLKPVMWPWFRRGADRWINRRLLSRSINAALAGFPRPRVAVTTVPIVAGLVGHLDVDAWLYYCVDDLAQWPGLDGEALKHMEASLVSSAHRVVAVSEQLRERLAAMGRDSALLTHGVDLDHWQTPREPSLHIPAGAHEPRIVFWGLLDDRLQSDWVAALADRLESGSILLVGPVESLDETLAGRPRVYSTGPVDYAALPAIAASATVLIMPYRDIPATRAMQPLKLKEYLASGLPCVARRLPGTTPWSDCLDLASTADEFVEAVLQRVETGLPAAQQQSRSRLADESWEAKATAFRGEIERTLAGVC